MFPCILSPILFMMLLRWAPPSQAVNAGTAGRTCAVQRAGFHFHEGGGVPAVVTPWRSN